MGRVFLFLTLAVAILIPASAQAQVNVWLQRGVSGVGVNTGIGFGSNQTNLIAEAGYSYKGFLEFDADIGWNHFSDNVAGSTDSVPLGGGVQFHPIKQSKEMPVSLSLQAIAGYLFVSNDALKNQGLTASAWVVGLAAGVYRFFPLAERVGVTPEFDFGWAHASTTISFQDTGEQVTSGSSDDALVTLGANVGFLDDSGHIWGLTPKLIFGTGPTTFMLSVNFVAPMP